ncbi:vitamin D(3) 25-hydroxylase-like [Paramacrobiotus metropolitanus]|uniref:vitamin D(3) 25-hydroxylase-like n=1 Tax=Paramacrobiotus metropolitanus TaxID=2943436 RepID=UPI002446098C|nr:vitamin D(3) 25-hydroxylase-like [Paramacrobiotus metropolitanus]
MVAIWITLLIFPLVYWITALLRRKSAKLPPGPKGLPVVGNLPFLTSRPSERFREWSKEYGDVMAVQMGYRTMIVISNVDTAKSLFNDDNTTGRDQHFILNRILNGKGLVPAEGEFWREQRRFALTTLRDLGMGKTWLEDSILDGINQVKTIFAGNLNRPFDPSTHLTLAIANVICALIFGRQYDHSDKEFLHLTSLFEENINILNTIAPTQFLPFLKFIPFGKLHTAQNSLLGNFQQLWNFGKALVREHTEERKSGQEKGDYVDKFLSLLEQQRGSSNTTFTDEQLLASVLNLFAAGTGTTHATIMWGILLMIIHPDVQQKVHEEIDAKIGRNEPIRMEHRSLLHYTDAVTLEIQRFATVAPLGVPHNNFDEMTVDGFVIPSRTLINLNIYGLHRNPRYWTHPYDFYPEHFLDATGSVFIPKGFAPFGIGKRACLGESLAKMEIYLIFANLMQTFHFSSAPGSCPSTDHCTQTFLRSPLPFDVIMTLRE